MCKCMYLSNEEISEIVAGNQEWIKYACGLLALAYVFIVVIPTTLPVRKVIEETSYCNQIVNINNGLNAKLNCIEICSKIKSYIRWAADISVPLQKIDSHFKHSIQFTILKFLRSKKGMHFEVLMIVKCERPSAYERFFFG